MIEKAYIEFRDIVTDGGEGELFPVPFNPTELHFEAGRLGEDKQKKGSRGLTVRLKMKLIFDKSLEMESVREETEQFLEAARDPLKRRVIFHWDMTGFDGLLEQMSAAYEMFSENGDPVRSRIDLTIESRSGSMAAKEWYNDYKELFSIEG